MVEKLQSYVEFAKAVGSIPIAVALLLLLAGQTWLDHKDRELLYNALVEERSRQSDILDEIRDLREQEVGILKRYLEKLDE